jgi:hypothetical protein
LSHWGRRAGARDELVLLFFAALVRTQNPSSILTRSKNLKNNSSQPPLYLKITSLPELNIDETGLADVIASLQEPIEYRLTIGASSKRIVQQV